MNTAKIAVDNKLKKSVKRDAKGSLIKHVKSPKYITEEERKRLIDQFNEISLDENDLLW